MVAMDYDSEYGVRSVYGYGVVMVAMGLEAFLSSALVFQ